MINTLFNNGYPLDFIFFTIRNRIKSFSYTENLERNSEQNNKNISESIIEEIFCFINNNISEKFKIAVKKFNIKIAHKPMNTLNNFIKTGKNHSKKRALK